jgi:hypothetical protein
MDRVQLTHRDIGRLLICIPRTRQLESTTPRPQEDQMSFWARKREPGAQGSRSVHTLLAAPEHHTFHRLLRRDRQVRLIRKDRIHPPPILPPRQPTRHDQREPGQSHKVSRAKTHGAVPGCLQSAQGNASIQDQGRARRRAK